MEHSAAARLVFDETAAITLYDVAKTVERKFFTTRGGELKRTDNTITLTAEDRRLIITLNTRNGEHALDISAENGTEMDATTLARAIYCIVKKGCKASIFWPGAKTPISSSVFISHIMPAIEPHKAARISPRRVGNSTRPKRRRLPALSRRYKRFAQLDTAYERDVRRMFLRDPNKEEMAALKSEMKAKMPPLEARLSTWAVSLTVATFSLPAALPVMAYNLTKGEDMRFASLSLALSGMFLGLNTSGAMAALPGF